jgi:RNA polymerase sigma-70 factor (ECF subfamily)
MFLLFSHIGIVPDIVNMKFPLHHDKFSLTDEALIQLLQSDDEGALKEIFNRFNARLYQLAVGVLRDEDLAKDIVQEVFIDLWNRRHTSNIQTLQNYLVKAIKFQALKQLRNGKLREHHLKLVGNILFVNQTEESIRFEELDHSLKVALAQLPPRCKKVFELSRYENLSHKEIAGKLGITAKTVEVQIHKALILLRKRLDKIVAIILAVLFS